MLKVLHLRGHPLTPHEYRYQVTGSGHCSPLDIGELAATEHLLFCKLFAEVSFVHFCLLFNVQYKVHLTSIIH